MRVGVIGINYKQAALNLRESLAQACQRCFVTQGAIHGEHTFVILNTCNRTEIYFSSYDLAVTHSYLLEMLRQEVDIEFDQRVYSYFGKDCFLHLARVTAGLDSAIVAETEIQGQVKMAYERASDCIPLPSEMHYLFQKALQVGKRVRAEIPMGHGMPDLEHAIYQTGVHFFNSVKDTRILVIGASGVNEKIVAFLQAKGLVNIALCNRSPVHARAFAKHFQLPLLEWSRLRNWVDFDWIILGTKAPEPLIRPIDLPSVRIGAKLVMDLSVPRNVDPHLARHKEITLLNIDQINRMLRVRKQRMSHLLSAAERLVCLATERQIECFQRRMHNKFYKQVV